MRTPQYAQNFACPGLTFRHRLQTRLRDGVRVMHALRTMTTPQTKQIASTVVMIAVMGPTTSIAQFSAPRRCLPPGSAEVYHKGEPSAVIKPLPVWKAPGPSGRAATDLPDPRIAPRGTGGSASCVPALGRSWRGRHGRGNDPRPVGVDHGRTGTRSAGREGRSARSAYSLGDGCRGSWRNRAGNKTTASHPDLRSCSWRCSVRSRCRRPARSRPRRNYDLGWASS